MMDKPVNGEQLNEGIASFSQSGRVKLPKQKDVSNDKNHLNISKNIVWKPSKVKQTEVELV